jgi:hypothetical protein
MADITLEIGVLNIKASPHPDGIYPKLLKRIAGAPIPFWGEDYLAITPPERAEAGIYKGRVLVWTELDPNAPALDKAKLEAVSLEDAHVAIDKNIGINLRVFYYVLRERDHLIFFESKNEMGKHMSPDRLQKAMERLFYRTNAKGSLRVDVDVMPEEDALEKILSIPRLGILEILLKKPNGDNNDLDAAEIIRELDEQGVTKKEIKLTAKSRKKGLKPNKRTLIEAEAASENGFVRGIGRDAGNVRVDLSTEKYPKIIHYPLADIASAAIAVLRVAKDTVIRRRRPSVPPA